MHKRTLFLLLCCCLFFTAKSESLRGFVITLDGNFISGTIERVNSSEFNVAVAFVNDFGTSYNYHPALIQGFVYLRGNEQIKYESHYHAGKWLFLQLLYEGAEMSLFKYPEIQVNWVVNDHSVTTRAANQKMLWLKQKRKAPFLLQRKHFRSKFSKLIKEKAPELAKKIGKRGYRYTDMGKILEEYDQIVATGIKKI